MDSYTLTVIGEDLEADKMTNKMTDKDIEYKARIIKVLMEPFREDPLLYALILKAIFKIDMLGGTL